MGTEIFPNILLFFKIVVGAIGLFSFLTLVISFVEYRRNRKNPEMQTKMREQIVNGLIGFVIILIVYLFISGIGPAFKLLFG